MEAYAQLIPSIRLSSPPVPLSFALSRTTCVTPGRPAPRVGLQCGFFGRSIVFSSPSIRFEAAPCPNVACSFEDAANRLLFSLPVAAAAAVEAAKKAVESAPSGTSADIAKKAVDVAVDAAANVPEELTTADILLRVGAVSFVLLLLGVTVYSAIVTFQENRRKDAARARSDARRTSQVPAQDLPGNYRTRRAMAKRQQRSTRSDNSDSDNKPRTGPGFASRR
mmetsp:Transcript_8315/g.14255  ORF Transcript_8315/g.14255 Transcript_8315/m.14255 type:complete len:223 (-) Transcript_8315:146-814(-)